MQKFASFCVNIENTSNVAKNIIKQNYGNEEPDIINRVEEWTLPTGHHATLVHLTKRRSRRKRKPKQR